MQQDKRTQPNRKRHSQPMSVRRRSRRSKPQLKQPRPRETKGLNECNLNDNSAHASQRPQQPVPGSGEPRKRLKMRSAMLKYVSCLGMTTLPLPPTKGSTAPNAGKKRFSLGSTPFLLAQAKEMGYISLPERMIK